MTDTLPDFDENGNLPLGCYTPNFDEFKKRFVDEFGPSTSRPNIFDGYLDFSILICEEMPSAMKQILNGSFTTDKENPGDMDLLLIFDGDIINRKEISKCPLVMNNSTIKDGYCCHSFPLVKYSQSKPKLYQKYLEKRDYWLDCWGSDRRGNRKGLIKIEMDKNEFERCKNDP